VTLKTLLNTEIRLAYKPKPVEISMICRGLSFLLDAGVQLPQALDIVAEYAKKNMRATLIGIKERITNGESLYTALLQSELPKIVAGMCRVGFETGNLHGVLGTLAAYFDREDSTGRSIVSALIYPAIVAVMAIAVAIWSVVAVLPNYAIMFESQGASLPTLTTLLLNFSSFMSRNWIVVLIIVCVVTAGLLIYCMSAPGQYMLGMLKMRAPIFRQLNGKLVNIRFCVCMSMMSSVGVSPVMSMQVLLSVIPNPYLDKPLRGIFESLLTGQRLSLCLKQSGIIDPVIVNMVRVGELSGKLTDVFGHCATYLESEYDRESATLTRLVEPAMTLILGVLTLVIMLSIILPTFELVNVY
jgi:type IV pilus assembly protein PilC